MFAPLALASSTSSIMSRFPLAVASGPSWTVSSIGSPIFSALIFDTKLSTNWSYTSAKTRKRFPAIQDWPLLLILAATAVVAAASMSAFVVTTKASEPPSSITEGLICRPARSATARPAGSEPVRVTAFMRQSSITLATLDAEIIRVMKEPSGKPARVKMSFK